MARHVQRVGIRERRVGHEQDPQAQVPEFSKGGEIGQGVCVALVGEVERGGLVGPRLDAPARGGRHPGRLPQGQLLHMRSGRIAARHEPGARGGDAAERGGGGGGCGHTRGIRRRPDDREPARDERAAEHGEPGCDQQAPLQRRRMRDHDVEISVRRGAQDLSRGRHDGREARARPERLEHGEDAGLLDGVGGAEPQRGRTRLACGHDHAQDSQASHARESGRAGTGKAKARRTDAPRTTAGRRQVSRLPRRRLPLWVYASSRCPFCFTAFYLLSYCPDTGR